MEDLRAEPSIRWEFGRISRPQVAGQYDQRIAGIVPPLDAVSRLKQEPLARLQRVLDSIDYQHTGSFKHDPEIEIGERRRLPVPRSFADMDRELAGLELVQAQKVKAMI